MTADVVLQVPALPQAGEDLNVTAWQMALGGCAGTVAYALGLFGVQADLCAPVGQGYYGEFVRRQLAQRGIASLLPPAGRPEWLLLLPGGSIGGSAAFCAAGVRNTGSGQNG